MARALTASATPATALPFPTTTQAATTNYLHTPSPVRTSQGAVIQAALKLLPTAPTMVAAAQHSPSHPIHTETL